MKRIPIRSTAIWFLFCLFGGTHALYGQAAASISGRVTDSGGSVVPAASGGNWEALSGARL